MCVCTNVEAQVWNYHSVVFTVWEYALVLMVETLHYKPEGRGFDAPSFWPHYGPGVTQPAI